MRGPQKAQPFVGPLDGRVRRLRACGGDHALKNGKLDMSLTRTLFVELEEDKLLMIGAGVSRWSATVSACSRAGLDGLNPGQQLLLWSGIGVDRWRSKVEEQTPAKCEPS